MERLIALVVLGAALVGLAGCASDKPEDPNRVSTMPWNKPEKWEGQGAMGGFMPNSN